MARAWIVPGGDYIDTTKLHTVPWNPPVRVSEETNAFKILKEWILDVGQIQAIIVCSPPDDWPYEPLPRGHKLILDGTRRWSVITSINVDMPLEDRYPVLVSLREYGMVEMLKIYHILNNTSMRHSGSQLMSAWLRNLHAVPPKKADEFATIMKHIGKPAFVRMEKAGRAITFYKLSITLCKALDREKDPESVVMVIDWMIKRGTYNTVQAGMRTGGTFAEKLFEAAKSDSKVKFDEGGRLRVTTPTAEDYDRLKIAR